jgi:uncharacterized membrane protein YagU involved in acid resistance
MEKDGAAPTLHARFQIVLQYDHMIIGGILAAQGFVTRGKWEANFPVVPAVTSSVTPPGVRLNRPLGHVALGALQTIRAAQEFTHAKLANRRFSITFALPECQPVATKNAGKTARTQGHSPLPR